jgi:YegS/Rv2252/BmrU family lipid kinase
MRPSEPLPIIINATAGTGHAEAECEKLSQLFAALGVEVKVLPASGPELPALAKRVAAGNPPTIVAGGGDGTMNAVASAIAGTGIALGVLPLGTLNHFAKDLSIPLGQEEAARTIVAGHTIQVDVGEVNGRVFINNSSIGLYPRIVRFREAQQRVLGRSKWMALAWATLVILRRSPFLSLRLKIEEEERRYLAPLVFIGNNAYMMEGLSIGTRERLDAGVLSLYVIQRSQRWALLGLALRMLFGRLQQARDFEAVTAQNVVVETRHRHLHVATDGEVTSMDTPLEYNIRPGALTVIVPAPAEPTT